MSSTWDVLDVLESLVDRSLVNADGERFWMLESVRAYALAQLSSDGATTPLADAHLQYVHDLVARAYDAFSRGEDERAWLRRLTDELENIRAALAWGFEGDGDVALAAATAARLGQFWQARGLYREGYDQLMKAIEATPEDDSTRARALNAAGALAWSTGRYEEARGRLEEAVAIMLATGNRTSYASALTNLGNLLVDVGDHEAAERHLSEALSIRRESGDRGASSTRC